MLAHRSTAGLARAVCIAAGVGLVAAPVAAEAQIFRNLASAAADPAAPLGPAIEKALDDNRVGDRTLRETLLSLEFEGCLAGERTELVAGLDALRRVHIAAVERRRLNRVWQTWERKLRPMPPEGWLLVSSWLDSREDARRRFFCEDGLPASWKGLTPDAYVIEAVTWFDLEAAEREADLTTGAAADRELAVMALLELRNALSARFETTFPDGPEYAEARDRLDERLDLMWDALVEPHHYGFTARARSTDPTSAAKSTRRGMPQSPFIGISIPDPQDVAARDRVVRSWRRQRGIVDRSIVEREGRLAALSAEIDEERDPAELTRLVRRASRIEAEIGNARADLVRLQNNVRYYSTGRPWIDSMLSNGYRKRNVRKLSRRDERLVAAQEDVREVLEDAVRRGATPPPSPRGLQGVAVEGPAVAGAGSAGGTPRAPGTPGPGDWLAGLPGAEAGAQTERTTGIPVGTGLVERRYEGPLPLPSAVWSADLVQAVRERNPVLDETDVRILLGLVRAAYSELPDRASVEEAVARALDSADGLRIRGEEATLSDLWLPGASRADQPVVTFLLQLRF